MGSAVGRLLNKYWKMNFMAIERGDRMSELQQLEQRLGTVIRSQCNTFGCRDCDMKWEGGCSATDLQNQIMEIEMQEHNTASHKEGNNVEL